MKLDRRQFVLFLQGIFIPSYLTLREKKLSLKSNSVHFVKAGTLLELPKNPRKGDHVQLITDVNAISVSSTLFSESDSILGESSDLELDSLGNFKFVYCGKKRGWCFPKSIEKA